MPLKNDLISNWGRGGPSRLSHELSRRRNCGMPVFNLATGTIGDHDIRFPKELLASLTAQSLPSLETYTPDPLGALPAREAIGAYYRRRGITVPPSSLLLGPGTSLLYFYLFRLLCRRGDDILFPSPGYPLLDDLAAVAGIHRRSYYLGRDGGRWHLDLDDLAFQVTPATRAVVVVAPHNPLGITPDPEEWGRLAALARERQFTVIVDEVFRESLPIGHAGYTEPPAGEFPLLVLLNGLSKMAFLPGLKVAWLAALFGGSHVEGFPKEADFLAAAERLSDSFLPVGELPQALVPGVMDALIGGLLDDFRERMDHLRGIACRELEGFVEAGTPGVHLVIPVGGAGETESLCCGLLAEEGVYLHPGEYYGLPGHLVMCFLEEEGRLREGCRRLARRLRRR